MNVVAAFVLLMRIFVAEAWFGSSPDAATCSSNPDQGGEKKSLLLQFHHTHYMIPSHPHVAALPKGGLAAKVVLPASSNRPEVVDPPDETLTSTVPLRRRSGRALVEQSGFFGVVRTLLRSAGMNVWVLLVVLSCLLVCCVECMCFKAWNYKVVSFPDEQTGKSVTAEVVRTLPDGNFMMRLQGDGSLICRPPPAVDGEELSHAAMSPQPAAGYPAVLQPFIQFWSDLQEQVAEWRHEFTVVEKEVAMEKSLVEREAKRLERHERALARTAQKLEKELLEKSEGVEQEAIEQIEELEKQHASLIKSIGADPACEYDSYSVFNLMAEVEKDAIRAAEEA